MIKQRVVSRGAEERNPDRNDDPNAWPTERSVHDVTLGPFFIARHEITKGQWLRISFP